MFVADSSSDSEEESQFEVEQQFRGKVTLAGLVLDVEGFLVRGFLDASSRTLFALTSRSAYSNYFPKLKSNDLHIVQGKGLIGLALRDNELELAKSLSLFFFGKTSFPSSDYIPNFPQASQKYRDMALKSLLFAAELFPTSPMVSSDFWFYAGFLVTEESASSVSPSLLKLGLHQIGKFHHRECPYDHFYRGAIAGGFIKSISKFPDLAKVLSLTSLSDSSLKIAIEYDNLSSFEYLYQLRKSSDSPSMVKAIYNLIKPNGMWVTESLKTSLLQYVFATLGYSKDVIAQDYQYLLSSEFFENVGRSADVDVLDAYLKILRDHGLLPENEIRLGLLGVVQTAAWSYPHKRLFEYLFITNKCIDPEDFESGYWFRRISWPFLSYLSVQNVYGFPHQEYRDFLEFFRADRYFARARIFDGYDTQNTLECFEQPIDRGKRLFLCERLTSVGPFDDEFLILRRISLLKELSRLGAKFSPASATNFLRVFVLKRRYMFEMSHSMEDELDKFLNVLAWLKVTFEITVQSFIPTRDEKLEAASIMRRYDDLPEIFKEVCGAAFNSLTGA